MYPPTGSIAAEGIKNQLGRPKADRLTVMVREAVQNSWDAWAGETAVEFGLHCWHATSDQMSLLRDVVFRSTPPETSFHSELAKQSGYLLAIYDRGTVGLGGPTRADIAPNQGERTDFVDFLRNIGQPPDHEFGGGTYGYGKAALYTASSIRAICVHTRCATTAGLESRFLAAGLGRQYTEAATASRKRFTGRHWWGRMCDDGVVDPLLDHEADQLATALGLPGYTDRGRGTTVLIPFPVFGERDALEGVHGMSRAILRYFWPKMVDGPDDSATIQFRVSFNGTEIPVPHPDTVPELKGFVAAFRGLNERRIQGVQLIDSQIASIDCRNPVKHLGKLSLVRYAPVPRSYDGINHDKGDLGEDPLHAPACHHIALMRTPHFAVRYLAGPPVPYEQLEFAGVFLADKGADAPFARSEPPTHDDWVPDSLEDPRERTFVRIAFRRIGEAISMFLEPPSPGGSGSAEVPLASFADELAFLIPAERGPGAALIPTRGPGGDHGRGRPTGTRAGGGGSTRPPQRARLAIQTSRMETINGLPVVVVDFDVENIISESVSVRAEAAVMLEGGSIEAEAPVGSARPQVVEWTCPDGRQLPGSELVTISRAESGRWSVAVSVPDDAMIGIAVTLAP
jgi:hypothetical protein